MTKRKQVKRATGPKPSNLALTNRLLARLITEIRAMSQRRALRDQIEPLIAAGMSSVDIARTLGVSKGTVDVTWARHLQRSKPDEVGHDVEREHDAGESHYPSSDGEREGGQTDEG